MSYGDSKNTLLLKMATLIYGGASLIPTSPILTGLELWLDASQEPYANDDTVPDWADESGNGRDLTQATGALIPTFKTGGPNGKSFIHFDGSDRLDGSPITLTNFTTFAVAKAGVSGNYQVIFSNGGTGEACAAITVNPSGNREFYTFNNNSVDGAASSDWEILTISWNGVLRTLSVNGASQVITNSGAAIPSATGALFVGNDAFGSALNGDVAEVLLYNSSLSAASLTENHRYLAAKYGITLP